MQKILVLDDSASFLADIAAALGSWGYEPLLAQNVAEAIDLLKQKPLFAIVDLFLSGDAGDELSNEFVEQHLKPLPLPYGRLTSAPRLVPARYSGAWVLHKYTFMNDPTSLREKIVEALA